jgi:nitroreductase
MSENKFIPIQQSIYSVKEMQERSYSFLKEMNSRRSIRTFSEQLIPEGVLLNCLKTAISAPSGANKQPWTLVVVCNKQIKQELRKEAENGEQKFYKNKKAKRWHNDLDLLNTNQQKPFLEQAPCLVVVFYKSYDLNDDGTKSSNYYAKESVGIMVGLLISALNHAGLSTLIYTPSRAAFLNKLLKRPVNEKPFMILPIGYSAKDTLVPNLKKKTLEEVAIFL